MKIESLLPVFAVVVVPLVLSAWRSRRSFSVGRELMT
jgi:hypothetical protein